MQDSVPQSFLYSAPCLTQLDLRGPMVFEQLQNIVNVRAHKALRCPKNKQITLCKTLVKCPAVIFIDDSQTCCHEQVNETLKPGTRGAMARRRNSPNCLFVSRPRNAFLI